MNEKQLIRQKIATYKKSLANNTTAYLSQKICCNLIETEMFQNAGCIALYYAMDDEVQTSGLIEEWYKEKTIALPVISGNAIIFHKYMGKEKLSAGALNIPEPIDTEQIPSEKIDLFIVPGVAFDRECSRMGRGKGYYDRYLSGINKPAIGICFGFQLLDHIPTEVHDIKMNMVITEDIILSSHHQ